MPFLLTILILLICLLAVGSVFAHPLTAFVQRRLHRHSAESEQLLLWGGLLLTAFVSGLLVMYLFLRL